MLVEVVSKTYQDVFTTNPHPFISLPFIELNKTKVDRVVRLVDSDRNSLGLVAGVKGGKLKSPFSAPFGGFHFRHEQMYISEIQDFASMLVAYAGRAGINSIEMTLPPDIYHPTFNAKVCSVLLGTGFRMRIPEITNWVDLRQFNARFNFRSSREYYNQGLRNKLTFSAVEDDARQNAIYDLVKENRMRMGRPIYMSFQDLKDTTALWPVDYFVVNSPKEELLAGAVMYRAHPSIIYAVFWGDSIDGRPLRAMDFLTFNLWSHYRTRGYDFIDLGISSESGKPNEGLLRFKETHECTSALRFSFIWTSHKA